ncbi:DUF1566 domain-containing protein [Thalassotalea nanhaiensis]|uniref:DUF1566 domain-containing protein n=1 Tax=Thalassotalea nanhaiensis TaxID=3065648 RepID=A0ABY9TF14_9GAMM|nr:DUF1566 domain-containing protein [Colwelliaceae bacterium SQ345]
MNNKAFMLCSVLLLSACGGGGGGGGTEKKITQPPTNPPTVSITAVTSAPEQTEVVLTPSISFDSSTLKSALWSQVSGPTVDVVTGENQQASFLAPVVKVQDGEQTLEFSLTVTDNNDLTTTESVAVTVQPINTNPVITTANIEAIAEQSSYTFAVEATDNDGSIASFSWTTENQDVVISDADKVNASFTAPQIETSVVIDFTLTVIDDENGETSKLISVPVNPVVSGMLVGTEFNPVNTNSTPIEERDVVIYDLVSNQILGSTKPNTDGSYSVMLQDSASLLNGIKVSATKDVIIESSETPGEFFTSKETELEAICYSEERHSCNATPISFLVARVLDFKEDISTRSQAKEYLEQALNINLSTDPFLDTANNNGIDINVIQTALLSSELTYTGWANSVLGFIEGSTEDVATMATYFTNIDAARLGVIITSNSATLIENAFDIVDFTATANLFGELPDGNSGIYNYQWELPQGHDITVENDDTTSKLLRVKLPDVEQDTPLTFMVTVTNDDFVASNEITLTVKPVETVDNTIPKIETLKDAIFESNSDIVITASASDGQDFASQLSVSWQQLSGPNVTLESTNNFTLSFKTPEVLAEAEKLVFEITVIDSNFGAATDTVDVYVTKVIELSAFSLNDTGVTDCGNYAFDGGAHNNNVNCLAPVGSEPLPNNQDAHFGRDVDNNDDTDGVAGFNYSKIAADGTVLSNDATEWSCVLDNVTGLMWERKTSAKDIHGIDTVFFYFDTDYSKNGGRPGYILKDPETNEPILDINGKEQANKDECSESEAVCLTTEEFVAETNQENLCGYADWRMPHKTELMSIVNYNAASIPTIDAGYFPFTKSAPYVTSTGIGEQRTVGIYETRKVAMVHFAAGESYYFNKNFIGNSTASRRIAARLVRVDQSQPIHAHGDIIDGKQTFDSVCNGFETKLYPQLPLKDEWSKMYCSNMDATNEACPDNHKGLSGDSTGKCCAYTVETRENQKDRAIWGSGDELEVLDVELGSCCSSEGCRGLSNGSFNLDAMAQ